jgi:hypothetical protein
VTQANVVQFSPVPEEAIRAFAEMQATMQRIGRTIHGSYTTPASLAKAANEVGEMANALHTLKRNLRSAR